MTILLKDISSINELTFEEIEPVVDNVKYAQRNDAEIEPVLANVKYAQRHEPELLHVAEAA
jgi:hypothetical protein